MNSRRSIVVDRVMLLIAAMCALTTALLARLYPHGQATDGYSYVDLADAMAEGRWGDAVNGYWSVLLPILLAPFRFFGAQGIVAYTVISVIVVISIVWLIYRIGIVLGVNAVALLVVCTVVGLRASLFSLEAWNADVLFAAVALAVTLAGIQLTMSDQARRWFLLGLLCGVLYYAKPVGLYTGLITFGLVWVVQFANGLREQWRIALNRLLSVTAGFSVAVLPWIAILSLKYGYLTTGYSGKHNLAISGHTGSLPFPFRLWDIPFDGASSYAGDYTYVGFELPYSIFSLDGVELVVGNIRQNLGRLWTEQPLWSMLVLLALIAFVVILDRTHALPKPHLIAFGAVLIQSFVYLPVLVEHRYLFFSLILMAILAPALVKHMIVTDGYKRIATYGVAAFSVAMLLSYTFSGGARLVDPLDFIRGREDRGSNRALIAESIDIDQHACLKFAVHWGPGGLRRNESIEIAHLFDWYNAGAIHHDLTDEEIIEELDRYDIDCILVWDDAPIPTVLEGLLSLEASDTEYGVVDIYRYESSEP